LCQPRKTLAGSTVSAARIETTDAMAHINMLAASVATGIHGGV
jgi:hypothetical protein